MAFGLPLLLVGLAPAPGSGGPGCAGVADRGTGRVNRVTDEARGFHPTGPP